jgi:hypothetical protein
MAARTFGLDEFALRLPAALFGVASVVITYMLGRTLFDRRVGLTAAAFIALSAWEFELSRYARFYTAFQASYCLALFCFLKAAQPDRHVWRYAFVATSMLSIAFHELSIVLATCFLIPILDRRAATRTRIGVAVLAVPFAVVWGAYRWASETWITRLAPPSGLEPLPPLIPSAIAARVPVDLPRLNLPDLSLLRQVAQEGSFQFIVLVGLAVSATWWMGRRLPANGWRGSAFPALAIAFGLAHQFLLAAFALVVHLVWYATSLRELWARRLWPAHAVLAAALAYWIVTAGTRLEGDWRAVALLLFGFPNLLQHFFYWFALGWPLFLIAIAASGTGLLARLLRDGDRSALFLLAWIALPLMAASAFRSFQEVRYVFHLYPLLVILFAWGLWWVWDGLAARVGRAHGARVEFRPL